MSSEYPFLDIESIASRVLHQDGSESAVQLLQITPQIARQILDNYNYPRNRNVMRRKVDELTAAMHDNSFVSLTTTINFNPGKDKKTFYLTDGQHRLSAIVKSGKSYVFAVMAINISADYVYPKTDRGLARSLLDAIRSSGIAYLLDLSETSTKHAAVGLKLMMEGYSIAHSANKVNEDKLLNILVERYGEQARRIFVMVDKAEFSRKMIGRIPMSLLLTLYTKLPEDKLEKIDEFIYGCSTGMGLSEEDVRRIVYNMYRRNARSGSSIRQTMSRGDELGTLLTAWKYWYNGKNHKNAFKPSTIEKTLKESPNVAGTDVTYIVKISPVILN